MAGPRLNAALAALARPGSVHRSLRMRAHTHLYTCIVSSKPIHEQWTARRLAGAWQVCALMRRWLPLLAAPKQCTLQPAHAGACMHYNKPACRHNILLRLRGMSAATQQPCRSESVHGSIGNARCAPRQACIEECGRSTSRAATVLSSFWSFSTRIASSDRAPASTGLSTRCTLSPFGVPSCGRAILIQFDLPEMQLHCAISLGAYMHRIMLDYEIHAHPHTHREEALRDMLRAKTMLSGLVRKQRQGHRIIHGDRSQYKE